MEKDVEKAFCSKKLQLVWRTVCKLGLVMRSYEIAVGGRNDVLHGMLSHAEAVRKKYPILPDFSNFTNKLNPGNFSNHCETFESIYSFKGDITRDLFFEASKPHPDGLDIVFDMVNHEEGRLKFLKGYDDYLDPDFEFSDDFVTFEEELFTIFFILIVIGEHDYLRVNFAAMKALFQAGKIIERLKYEGIDKKDRPSNIGSKQKKNRYSDQDILEAFHRCERNNLNAMQKAIAVFLTAHKKRTRSSKDIPSRSTIERALKKEGLDKKLKK